MAHLRCVEDLLWLGWCWPSAWAWHLECGGPGWFWLVNGLWGEASAKVLTVEVADMPRDDGRRVQFAARAWDEQGQAFDLMLSDYQRRDWAVGSRWSVSARVRPVIGEVNVRGLNREIWALANGIGRHGVLWGATGNSCGKAVVLVWLICVMR